MSIYKSSITPDTPQALGCYADSSDRTLNGPNLYKYDLTPSYCFDWCGKQGYSFAGMENGSQVSENLVIPDLSATAAEVHR
jgi:hypothetical protein